MNQIDTPELNKLHAVQPYSQAIGEFLDWLSDQGILLMYKNKISGDIYPYQHTVTELLAEYYKIDLGKIDQEQKTLLAQLQEIV